MAANSAAFESTPLVKPTGFREYDARWWFGHMGSDKAPELNLMGVQALGMGFGTLLGQLGGVREVVTGHDYRSYSGAIKQALITGLMATGCRVHDIGLALSPMDYFAQFALDVPAVAMVTASHNDNGWTGVKMGCDRPVTFGPDEMSQLKDIVLTGNYDLLGAGSYIFSSRLRRTLYCRSDKPTENRTSFEDGGGLRQRYRGHVRAAYSGGFGLRSRAARLRSRLQFPPA
jgi:phosphomannomutase/phosphoglucomutase